MHFFFFSTEEREKCVRCLLDSRSWLTSGPLLLKSGEPKERKDFFTSSQKCQRAAEKNFLEETFTFFSLVFSAHLLPFLLRRILVYTPVYIIKPPHEDANFHTGFISNNFKKMSTTTANPPASAAATKGTRDEFCVFTRIIEIIFGRSLGAFLRRKIVFLLLGDGKEGEMWG